MPKAQAQAQTQDRDTDQTAQDEESLNSIIDQVMILSDNPQKDDALIQRLQYDLATGVHPPAEIARRYGLFDVAELKTYLLLHPEIVDRVKKLRAMYQSEAGIEDRMRSMFQYATEDLIPIMHDIVKHPSIPIAQRIDSFKQLQRGAGMDGQRAEKDGQLAGQRFVLNIMFDGGQDVRLSGTAPIDPQAIPSPPMHLGTVTEAEEDQDPLEGEDV